MKDIEMYASMLMISGFRGDELIGCFKGICDAGRDTAIGSYMRLCELLLSSGRTLSDYIFELACSSGDDIFREYFRSGSQIAFDALARDIGILSHISGIKSCDLIGELRERFGLSEDISFPVYENGSCVISPEAVISYRKRFGTVLYADNKAFIYENGTLSPVKHFDRISISSLKSYEVQRNAVLNNTVCFIKGQKYSNVLLYGDRGTGKSSTVKAIVNEFPELRIVLVPKSSVMKLYDIYELLRGLPLKFILFLDDMSFADGEPEYGFLKQALEGSVNVMPDNCVIYATTNRRHIIRETASEREDEHNAADARDEKASLADRFGIYITFMQPDKKCYLDIVKSIAADRRLDISEDRLCALAERFAVRKGNRSPRTATQFADMIEARLALGMDHENL